MALEVIQGIESIKIGAIGVDGAMGATLVAVPLLNKDSVLVDMPEAATLFQKVEGTAQPIIAVADDADPTLIQFSTKSISATMIANFFGGTTSGVGDTIWTAPTVSTNIYKSVEIVTKENDGTSVKLEFPYVLMKAKGNLMMKNSESGAIEANCIALSPTDGSGDFLPYVVITRS